MFHSIILTLRMLVDVLLNDDLKGEELWVRVTSYRSRCTTQWMVSVRISCLESILTSFPRVGSPKFGFLDHAFCYGTNFPLPLHWTKATDFPDTATHAIDFSPGGANGIGPTVSRILSGRGVHAIIVLGDKSKGGELYDPIDIKCEDWWSKKWAPRLVKTGYVSTLCEFASVS